MDRTRINTKKTETRLVAGFGLHNNGRAGLITNIAQWFRSVGFQSLSS
jgi:hypothetical protein